MNHPNDQNTPQDTPTEAFPSWGAPAQHTEPTRLIPGGDEPTRVLPATPPTQVLTPAASPESEPELRRPRGKRGDGPKLRLTKRGRILLIVGIAIAVVIALVAGLLVTNALGARSAADELAAAQEAAADAEADFTAASAAADESVAALTTLIAAADAGLAITGEGLDEAARPPLVEDRDAAELAATTHGESAELVDVPDAAVDPARGARENAEALRARADALEANTASEVERAKLVDDAAGMLRSAMTAYLSSTAVVGAAVLADRGDAADDTKTALQAQLDGLVGTEPDAFADALTAYRAAVDAVVASSEAARAPTPGGSGVRVPDPASVTVVVNKRRGLPADYVPSDLVMPPGVPNNNGQPVRQVLVADLLRMQADMAAEGITLRIGSAYRSYADQGAIYNRFVRNEGVAGADTHSARPGNSEHQTGLALDLDDGTGCNLSTCFKDKPGGIWLAANAWKYGFILRYGDGWQPIVGYRFEPWHYRYVGVDVATDMHNKGIKTLEEYYGLPAAPDYG